VEPGKTAPIDDGRAGHATDADHSLRPHLFLLMRCDAPRTLPIRLTLHRIDEVQVGRSDRLEYARVDTSGLRRLNIGIPDATMSSTHARMVQAFGRWQIEDAGSKNGTVVDGKPCVRQALRDGALIELGHALFIYRESVPTAPDDPLDHDPNDLRGGAPPLGLETLLPPLGRSFARLARIAPSSVPVILLGETGVGKELLAAAVHRLSGRRGAFVPVNCGALPPALIESELFGHRKGAFTGAVEDRIGLVQAADGGTLFLDEIGDLKFPSQAALLRVLQEREVRAVGATRSVPVDLRVVAATHRNLAEQVELGSFRADLYARLMGFEMRLPPLRERREDLGLLIARLLERLAPAPSSPSFTLAAARALVAHDWPHNVRGVERCLEAAVVLAGAGPIEFEHLPSELRNQRAARSGADPDVSLRISLEAALREHAGNISAVARSLGKARPQIQRWLKRFGIDPAAYRN
jgi:pSer/pThr/pTyr-binding forkhead associated (FHA) protein